MSRKKDYNKWTRIVRGIISGIVALAFILLWSRAVTYRKVIFDYQKMTETTDAATSAALCKDIERKVGRPNTAWYKLEKTPRYRHFWDEYNVYSNIQREMMTYGLDD